MREYDFNQTSNDKSPYLIYQSLRVEPANSQELAPSNQIPKPSVFNWFLSRNKQEFQFRKPSKLKTTK